MIFCRNSCASVTKELDLKRTQLLWEANKLSETETKLHHSEQEQAKLRKEQTKLRMRLQEAMEKLEQGDTFSGCVDYIYYEFVYYFSQNSMSTV